MDRETLREIKRAYDEHTQRVRGILLGAVQAPNVEAGRSALPLSQRYALLAGELEEAATFYSDYKDPYWQVTRSVVLFATSSPGPEEGPAPRVAMRFRRNMLRASEGPTIIVAEFFDIPDDGSSPDLDRPGVGFLAERGQLIASEYVSVVEIPEDSPYRQTWPGEDPRTPEDRMTQLELSYAQFVEALANPDIPSLD